jgi:hypothetical protein
MKTVLRTRPWRLVLLFTALCLSLGCPMAKKEVKKERQVPDAEAQAEKEKEILDLFKDRDPGELARTYYEKGLQTKDDPAGRYVLLRLARDKAAEKGDVHRAYEAVDELAKSFDDVDALEMKKDVLLKAAQVAKTPDHYFDSAEDSLKLIDQCIDADKFEAANALLDLIDKTRPKLKPEDGRELEPKINAAKVKIQETQREFESAKDARDTLEAKADDKGCNLTWGKYLCLVKNNWEKGLPLLEKSGDEELAPAAKKDLNKPANGEEQVRMGDEWWDLALKEQGMPRAHLKDRAVFWYKKAESSVSGLTQERIKKNIREVEKKD